MPTNKRITIRHRGQQMHYVAQMDDENQIALIEFPDHVPQSAVGTLVDFKLLIALHFTKIDVGIHNYRVGELIGI